MHLASGTGADDCRPVTSFIWRTRVWTSVSDVLLPHRYPSDSFSLSPLSAWICSLCHCCLDSEKHFRHNLIEAACAVCRALSVVIKKVEVVGEFRNITRKHGLMIFVHEARQWLKASHPSPRRQVLLSPPPRLLLQSAKHLAYSWELSSAIRPIASSALLCTDLMGPDHKIIVLTWKIQRLAWLRSTTFSTVD